MISLFGDISIRGYKQVLKENYIHNFMYFKYISSFTKLYEFEYLLKPYNFSIT